MARIKIRDLPKGKKISDKELKHAKSEAAEDAPLGQFAVTGGLRKDTAGCGSMGMPHVPKE